MIINQWVTIGSVFLILLLGLIASKLGSKVITVMHRRKHKTSIRRVKGTKIFTTVVMLLSLLASLLILQVDITSAGFLSKLYDITPQILSVVLIITFVVILVNVFMNLMENFLKKSGFNDFVKEYNKEILLKVILWVIRCFLYVSLGLAGLTLIKIDVLGIVSALGVVFYPVFILFLALLFYGLRDIVENYIAGIYLRSSKVLNVGEIIKVNNELYTVEDIKNQGITANAESGLAVFIPNKKFFKDIKYYKNVVVDLKTLEEIKSHFVAQDPSFCGPASASMILSIFGHYFSQHEIGKEAGAEVGKGTHPESLIKAVEKLTKKEVIGKWIDYDEIKDIKEEISSWLNDGALIIVDYKKSYLFPTAKRAHYSACLAVEGDELVILDPSGKAGGVYLADYRRIQQGMDTYSELIKGKRGYVVLAPRGSRAYYRIKEGLIYSDVSLYIRMSKILRKKFEDFMTKAQQLDFVLPENLRSYIDDYKERQKIARVWEPWEAKGKK